MTRLGPTQMTRAAGESWRRSGLRTACTSIQTSQTAFGVPRRSRLSSASRSRSFQDSKSQRPATWPHHLRLPRGRDPLSRLCMARAAPRPALRCAQGRHLARGPCETCSSPRRARRGPSRAPACRRNGALSRAARASACQKMTTVRGPRTGVRRPRRMGAARVGRAEAPRNVELASASGEIRHLVPPAAHFGNHEDRGASTPRTGETRLLLWTTCGGGTAAQVRSARALTESQGWPAAVQDRADA
jgi:hypothetical protein